MEGFDPDNALNFWVDHLPGGAVFDAQAGVLRWQTDYQSAGRYGTVTLCVSDGLAETARRLRFWSPMSTRRRDSNRRWPNHSRE